MLPFIWGTETWDYLGVIFVQGWTDACWCSCILVKRNPKNPDRTIAQLYQECCVVLSMHMCTHRVANVGMGNTKVLKETATMLNLNILESGLCLDGRSPGGRTHAPLHSCKCNNIKIMTALANCMRVTRCTKIVWIWHLNHFTNFCFFLRCCFTSDAFGFVCEKWRSFWAVVSNK